MSFVISEIEMEMLPLCEVSYRNKEIGFHLIQSSLSHPNFHRTLPILTVYPTEYCKCPKISLRSDTNVTMLWKRQELEGIQQMELKHIMKSD